MTEAEANAWIEEHMPAECVLALAGFVAVNPDLRGIEWGDALEMLIDADRHLDVIEPMVEQMPEWGLASELAARGMANTNLYSYVTLTLLYASAHFRSMDTAQRVIAVRATIEVNSRQADRRDDFDRHIDSGGTVSGWDMLH